MGQSLDILPLGKGFAILAEDDKTITLDVNGNYVRIEKNSAFDNKINKMNTFKEYQEFVNGIKVYPEKHAILYPTLGMMGEAGEVSEKIKKWLRGDGELDKEAVVKEMGDVLWYLASLADDLGFTLDDVANRNVDKLSARKEQGKLKGNGDNREEVSPGTTTHVIPFNDNYTATSEHADNYVTPIFNISNNKFIN